MNTSLKNNIQTNFFDAINQREFDRFSTLYSEDVVIHRRSGECSKGVHFVSEISNQWCASFPDLKITTLHFDVEGNQITVHWKMTGTFEHALYDISATGKKALVYGHTRFRFSNGKVVEHFGLIDYRSLS